MGEVSGLETFFMRKLIRNLLFVLMLALAIHGAAGVASAQLGDPDLTTMHTLRDQYGWGAVFGWQTGELTCSTLVTDPQTGKMVSVPAPCTDNPCPIGVTTWPGVSCDQGRVVVLNLICTAALLNAPIPPILSQLTGLTGMDIRNCGLTGAIPDLSSLNQLTRLRLSGNHLTGPIPGYLTSFPTLGVLELGGNLLSGAIPLFPNSTAIVQRFPGNFLTEIPPAWTKFNRDVSYNCYSSLPATCASQ